MYMMQLVGKYLLFFSKLQILFCCFLHLETTPGLVLGVAPSSTWDMIVCKGSNPGFCHANHFIQFLKLISVQDPYYLYFVYFYVVSMVISYSAAVICSFSTIYKFIRAFPSLKQLLFLCSFLDLFLYPSQPTFSKWQHMLKISPFPQISDSMSPLLSRIKFFDQLIDFIQWTSII